MDSISIRKNAIRTGAFILAGLMLAAAFLLGRSTWQAHAQAGAPGTGSAAPSAVDAGPFACTIANIAVFSSRIHVYCNPPTATGIAYFAAAGDTLHAVTTNRFLMMLNTAYSLGKKVYIYYLDSSTYNIPGCNAGDCRTIDWMFIVP